MRFSVIVVSLNAGEELKKTVESVLCQSFKDYEILVKDGGSADGSVEALPRDEHLRVVTKKDRSIYDAMNQAVRSARGDYFLFLNCGDYLYDGTVLAKTAAFLLREPADIVYGDLYRRALDSTDTAPGAITDFVCYRNVPCHQVCFYARHLFGMRGYRLRFPVRADYEHFLYCIYRENAKCAKLPFTVCSYQGGGFSETEEHRMQAKKEHAQITRHYLGRKALLYRLLMIATLQPLREKLAEDPKFSAAYHGLKKKLYGGK